MATLGDITDVAVDASGNLFIADASNSRIRRVSAGGIITTVAGNGTGGFSGDGGPATSASLGNSVGGPQSIAVDAAGNLFIADTDNNRIRKVSADGMITTFAGDGTVGFAGDGGPATSAAFSYLARIAVDASGNLFIADGNRIRKVLPTGVVTTAGNKSAGFSGDGGPATAASLSGARGIAVDAFGNLFITDLGRAVESGRFRPTVSLRRLPVTATWASLVTVGRLHWHRSTFH